MTHGSPQDVPTSPPQQLDQQVARTSRHADQLHQSYVQAAGNLNNPDDLRPSQLADFERIRQEANIAAGDGPSTAGGSRHYAFDPAAIEGQLAACQDLIGKLQNDALSHARGIAQAAAPSRDDYSVSQAAATRNLGNNVVQRVQNQITFVRAWHDKLVQARQRYMEQEHLSEDQWKTLSRGLDT